MAKIECSNRLRVILAEKEITNRWLAEQMGVTDMTVSRWKTNKVQPSMAHDGKLIRYSHQWPSLLRLPNCLKWILKILLRLILIMI